MLGLLCLLCLLCFACLVCFARLAGFALLALLALLGLLALLVLLALLALLPGVARRCWQLVGVALLGWLLAMDFGLHVKLGHSGLSLVRVT